MSMYNITKDLPTKYQKPVKRKLFLVVSDAEDQAEDETKAKEYVEQNLQNTQHFFSSTTYPTDTFSCSLTQEFLEFSTSTSTSVNSSERSYSFSFFFNPIASRS